jgi:hypothetical protein
MLTEIVKKVKTKPKNFEPHLTQLTHVELAVV